jgi:hypothetical protein
MKTPWNVTPSGEILPVEPARWLFEPGSWAEVEVALGATLPSDYKALIGSGRACVFDEELFIASPFDPYPHNNLVHLVASASWSLAHLRAHVPSFNVLVYPEEGGLMAWGVDSGGGEYHWDSQKPDPDQWTVCIEGRPLDPVIEHRDLSLTRYFDALQRGQIAGATLSGWPGPHPVIRRMNDM